MTKRKRRKFSSAFKAQVGLEALKGIKTINQIAADYELHPVQVSTWKKDLAERLPDVFDKPTKRDLKRERREEERLERKVGQLTMEVDFHDRYLSRENGDFPTAFSGRPPGLPKAP